MKETQDLGMLPGEIIPTEKLFEIQKLLPEILGVLEKVSYYSKGGPRTRSNEFETITHNARIDGERQLIENFYNEITNLGKII